MIGSCDVVLTLIPEIPKLIGALFVPPVFGGCERRMREMEPPSRDSDAKGGWWVPAYHRGQGWVAQGTAVARVVDARATTLAARRYRQHTVNTLDKGVDFQGLTAMDIGL